MKHKSTSHNILLEISTFGILLLLVIMPFHAALVTIIGSIMPDKLILQSWKEIVILSVATLVFLAYIKDRSILKLDTINKIVLIIIGFSSLITLVVHTNLAGTLAGIKTNISVLVLFLAVQTFSNYIDKQRLTKLVLYPAFFVAVIAIIQPWLFSPDLLSKIGYNTTSILGGQYIEASKSAVRVFSTLGGPNQLGAYLIIPFSLCLALGLNKKTRLWLIAALGLCIPIYMTYSRSAWLGLIFASILIITLRLKKDVQIVIATIIGLVALLGIILFFNINPCGHFKTIQAQFLHGSCIQGSIEGPDAERIQAIQTGLATISTNPMGYGLGSAGPASFYSNSPRIVENWFLQITIEIGFIGLVLYILMFILLLKELYFDSQNKNRDHTLSSALFGALVGILITGMFLHSLGDSTLAIILFILLGLNRGYIRS